MTVPVRRPTTAAEALLRSRWPLVLGRSLAFEMRLGAARRLLRAERGRFRADGTGPGQRLLDAVPDALGRLGDRFPHGTVLVSGTNGKTTTTAMLAAILRARGMRPVTNRIGSNQPGGVAAELVAATGRFGRIAGDIGVLEVDELWLDRVMDHLTPRVLVLENLFRDQLDRLGELDLVANRWTALARRTPPSTRFVLCADDARVSGLPVQDPVLFGLEDRGAAVARLPHAADPMHCGTCDRRHQYEAVYLSHLGDWHCSTCGAARPRPTVFATDVRDRGSRGSRFVLHVSGERTDVALRVPGLYNVYNALAAAAAAHVLGVPPATVASALAGVPPAFGRGEVVAVGQSRLKLFLAKNPTGLNEVVRTLTRDPAPPELVFLLGDSVYDSRDTSWIWDADLEEIAPRLPRVVCGGTRAADIALRLKYAGVPSSGIVVVGSTGEALEAVRAAEEEVPVVANYSAMLDVRDLLADRGHAERVWR